MLDCGVSHSQRQRIIFQTNGSKRFGGQAVLDEYAAFHASEDKAYDHISADDRAKVSPPLNIC